MDGLITDTGSFPEGQSFGADSRPSYNLSAGRARIDQGGYWRLSDPEKVQYGATAGLEIPPIRLNLARKPIGGCQST